MLLLAIALCFVFLLVSLAGYALARLLAFQFGNPFVTFWIGLFPVGVLGLLISCFVPLSGCHATLCFAPSLAGLILFIKTNRHALLPLRKKTIAVYTGLFCFLLLLFAYKAAYQVILRSAGDTLGYHLHAVRYLREYGVVPGIGNLHFRLGMNSLWHVLAALVEQGPMVGRSSFLMPALLALGGTSWAIGEFFSVREIWKKIFIAAIFPFVGLLIVNLQPSLYYDNAALFLSIILFYYSMKIIASPQGSLHDGRMLLIFTATAFLTKTLSISCIVFPLLIVCHTIISTRHNYIKNVIIAFILPALAALAWCAKNILLTGYPFYPLPLLPIPVDWAMPLEKVSECFYSILGWARMPNEHYLEALEHGLSFWIFPYLKGLISIKHNLVFVIFPLLSGAVAWTITLIRRYSFINLSIFFFAAANILFWFVSAPDPRFGLAFFWIFFASGLSAMFIPGNENNAAGLIARIKPQMLTPVLALGMFLLFASFYAKDLSPAHRSLLLPGVPPTANVRQALIQPEQEKAFPVWIANREGEWTGCADGPLPCTMYASGFCLRNSEDWSQGFKNCKSRMLRYLN